MQHAITGTSPEGIYTTLDTSLATKQIVSETTTTIALDIP
jgi:hypothetical protein